MSNFSPEGIADSVRVAHDVYVNAILDFRKAPSRDARVKVDDAAMRYEDAMAVLFDPSRPYVKPKPKGRKPSAENSEASP